MNGETAYQDISYELDEHQEMIRHMARDFAEQHIRPKMMKWDEDQIFPREVFKEMGHLGMMGTLVDEKYGGAGLGYIEYITIIVEIARVCGSIGLSLAAHNSLGTQHINQFGNESQKSRWLPKLTTGEHIAAWALTEPNTGSDAMRMKCTAKKEGNEWVINGTKCWITHGISGDIVVVIARTGALLDAHGITAFVVERDRPGLMAGKKENKLGMRASETAEVIFDNCRIPEENVLGEVGGGFIQAMKILDGGRISIGSLGLGIATGALEAAIRYSKEREQFGKPISYFQGIAFKLAEMATKVQAASLLCYRAGDMKNKGQKVTKESAMAKYFASETAVDVSTEAVQIFGGYGYTKDFPVEKFYRDSKLTTIGEGTSEIQKLVIAREALS